MSENICSVCGEKFEDKYFDKQQDKCIMHCDKNTWYKMQNNEKIWKEELINKFWRLIQNNLCNLYCSQKDGFDFSKEIVYENVLFPKFQVDYEYYEEIMNTEDLGTNFYDYDFYNFERHEDEQVLNTIFDSLNVSFKHCIFLDKASFSRYNFQKNVIFEECRFFESVDFSKMLFIERFKLIDCKFYKYCDFHRTKFNNLVGFEKSTFYDVNFKNVRFKKMTRFKKTIFKEDINFKHTYFEDEVLFNNAIFHKRIDLIDAIFYKKPNFLNVINTNNEKYNIGVINRETARIIKDSFEYRNNIIDANMFYALEMKEREKELSWSKSFLEKLIFSCHEWSSNHSQDWLLALFWILNISFITSMFGFQLNNNSNGLQVLDRTLFTFCAIILIGIVALNLKKYIGNWSLGIVSMIMYFIHSQILGCYSLDEVSNRINPFSIMIKGEDLTFGLLIFKVTIAYLIYQLIISIRQNTRRK